MSDTNKPNSSTSVSVGGNVGGHVVVGDNNTATSETPDNKPSQVWWEKIVGAVIEFFKGK